VPLAVAVVVILAAVLVVVRLNGAEPTATVATTMKHTVNVPLAPVSIPWQANGLSAIAVPSIGVAEQSGPEQPVPVASLTKMMTAYVILHDHPLTTGQPGPDITMDQADVDEFNNDTVTDQANAQVTVGEVLTELQLLGGLLVHSANNYAFALARWDAGSVPAFVAKMNSTAAQLGMSKTHYADASGYDQNSQSTAGDLLKVAGPDMLNPVFASLVKMPSITLPVAGTISTYTPLLGIQGVIGVKSGFTTVAGGCDVVAVYRTVHGKQVLILAGVTGVTGANVLYAAGLDALNLSNAVAQSISPATIVRQGTPVAHVTAAGHTVDAVAQSTANVLAWPLIHATETYQPGHAILAGAKKGTRIGSLMVGLGSQRVVIPVRLSQDLPQETWLQRLF
jgi:D-alanyl-D-alanine carboxypeptidase